MDQPINQDNYKYISVVNKVPHDLLNRVATALKKCHLVSSKYEEFRKSMFSYLSFRVNKDCAYVGKSVNRQRHQSSAKGPDFRCVRIAGIEHTLSFREAQIVKILWEAHENGTPDVSKDYIIDKVCGPDSKIVTLRDAFTDRLIFKAIVAVGKRRGTVRIILD